MCADHTHKRKVHNTHIRDNDTRTSRSPTSQQNRASIEKPQHIRAETKMPSNRYLFDAR